MNHLNQKLKKHIKQKHSKFTWCFSFMLDNLSSIRFTALFTLLLFTSPLFVLIAWRLLFTVCYRIKIKKLISQNKVWNRINFYLENTVLIVQAFTQSIELLPQFSQCQFHSSHFCFVHFSKFNLNSLKLNNLAIKGPNKWTDFFKSFSSIVFCYKFQVDFETENMMWKIIGFSHA